MKGGKETKLIMVENSMQAAYAKCFQKGERRANKKRREEIG